MSDDLILKEVEENKEKYIEFLKNLIKVNSYNPPGNEKSVALIIENYLVESGVKCEVFPFGENRANIMAFLNEEFDSKNLLYNGHMDVVPPGTEEEWKYPPLSAFVKRNKFLYGRGTSDMKGGLAAMVIALGILKKLNLNVSGNLMLNAVADEETGGQHGTGWCLENILKKRSIKCDFAIIGEPSGLSPLPKAIVLGEKGHLVIKVITNGISCHSMAPFMGKNAIYMMSELIQNLDKLEEYIPKVEPPISLKDLKLLISSAFPSEEIFNRIFNEQPLFKGLVRSLTEFTKSLNIIHSGIKENVVPDHCEALIDFRLYPGQTTEMILNGLKHLIRDLGYEVRDEPRGKPEDVFVYLEVYHEGQASIWKNYESSQPLKDFKDIVDEVYQKKSFYFLAPGSTDAHYYRNNNYCVETIHFGPGNAGSMHALNEYIEIQDFVNAIKVYSLFAYQFLK